MESKDNALFIVLEEHMLERYKYIISKYNFISYQVTGFSTLQIDTSLTGIVKRVYNRQIIFNEYNKLSKWINTQSQNKEIKTIYFSNSEGYIAHNFIKKIKQDFPSLNTIGLQHGVFILTKVSSKRKMINNILYKIFHIYPFGVGFGSRIVDKYIVFNNKYKDFLIHECDWNVDDIIVDLNFLKYELYVKIDHSKKEDQTVIFLLQCLSKTNLTTLENEKYLNQTVLDYLSKEYNTVLIKKHPACQENIFLDLKNNTKYIDNLIEGLNYSSKAYSFFSTTLIEAEIFNIKAYSIYSNLINIDKKVYEIFDEVIDLKDIKV